MDRERIRALLEEPADVNAPQADGMTALHWAALHDDLEMAKPLIGAGARVNAANRYGVTPLISPRKHPNHPYIRQNPPFSAIL